MNIEQKAEAMTTNKDLKRYAGCLKLPLVFSPDGSICDGNHYRILVLSAAFFQSESEWITVGTWLAEQINKGLEEVRG